MNVRQLLSVLLIIACAIPALACSSLIASADATLSGRPILWKHRDTSATNNFLYRVEADTIAGHTYGFVALFNGADSLTLDEAWMGMNDAGFAIMNTVAYNLAPNKRDWTDREGFIMAKALAICAGVDDFAALLDSLPKPLGVQTNFGVIDAAGNGAYFETDDYKYQRFNLADAPGGVLIRTNYAYSGTPDQGKGYIRHDNVKKVLESEISTGSITPISLTDGVSRSFYNTVLGYDALATGDSWAVDMDFVPRHSSTASIAIEGILPGESPDKTMMWANIGYPPCSHTVAVTLSDIPAEVGPTSPEGAYSPMGLEAHRLMDKAFPINRGNGPKYVNLDVIRPINEDGYTTSLANYAKANANRTTKKKKQTKP